MTKMIKSGVYTNEIDLTIYSTITKKCYNSIKEYEKDIRKFKLNKIAKTK